MRVKIVKRNEQTFPLLVVIKSGKTQSPEEQAILMVTEDSNQRLKGMLITGPQAGNNYGKVSLEKDELYEILPLGSEITLIQT